MSSFSSGFASTRFPSSLLLLVLLLALSARASEAQTVSFSTDRAGDTFGCSETITLFVNVDGFADLRGFSWILTYDPSVMTPISVTPGTAWGACSTADYWTNEGTANGTVEVDVVGLGCSVPGPGSVLEVVFEAASPGNGLSAGSSAVSLSGRARDSDNTAIAYSVTDGSVTYACNVAPVAVDDDVATDEDVAVDIDVTANDTDVDGTVNPTTVAVTTGPTNGSFAVEPTTGAITYTPGLNFSGIDSFQYTVDDDDGATSSPATVTVTVNPVNDAPTAQDDEATTDEDVAVAISVLTNDSDLDGTLDPASIVTSNGPANGGLSVDLGTGVVTYTPDPNFNGVDSFQYTVDDDLGATSNLATVSITVDPVNDPPVLTDPGDQTSVEGDIVALSLTSTDVDGPDESWSAVGLPSGLSIDTSTGEISGTVACDASLASPYAVSVTVDDTTPATDTVNFTWTVNPVAAPAAITDLAASQVKSGNDTDGTTRISLTWSGVGGGNGIRIFRRSFGGYPEYTGSVPALPASLTAAQSDVDWVETAVTSSGESDEVGQRDFWYYVAFVENPCGNQVSGPSNLTAGTLNYHLGDVSDGVTTGQGDNVASTSDVAAIGLHYGITSSDGSWLNFLDVGPTTDFTVDARPAPDDLIDFEDLILLAINYGAVGKSDSPPDPSDRNRIILQVPSEAEEDRLEVSLHMEADGRVQGMSLPLTWDATVVEPTGAFGGELLAAQGRLTQVLTPRPGVLDVALFGVGERGLSGEGRLATVTFRVIGEGDPDIDLGAPVARDADNASLTLETDRATSVDYAAEIPQVSYLEQNFPNPFNPSTNIRFGLAEPSRVEIRVYSLSGRMVRTLVSERMPAGAHTVTWNGRDDAGTSVASGTYLVRLTTADGERTRRMALIK